MIAVLLDVLRSGEPSFKKDSVEYQFRRVLIEIIHRIPSNEGMRPNTNNLMNTMLHLLKFDGEENGVTCVKIIIDIVRTLKTLSEEHVTKFLAIFQDLLGNVRELVTEYLSDDSAPLDPNLVLPSARSFKVMSECPIIVVSVFLLPSVSRFERRQMSSPDGNDLGVIDSIIGQLDPEGLAGRLELGLGLGSALASGGGSIFQCQHLN